MGSEMCIRDSSKEAPTQNASATTLDIYRLVCVVVKKRCGPWYVSHVDCHAAVLDKFEFGYQGTVIPIVLTKLNYLRAVFLQS